jgi:hypothetical protein
MDPVSEGFSFRELGETYLAHHKVFQQSLAFGKANGWPHLGFPRG